MSSRQVLPSNARLLAAAVCCGLWQLLLAGVLNGGWGGKLGTAALLGVLTVPGREGEARQGTTPRASKRHVSLIRSPNRKNAETI